MEYLVESQKYHRVSHISKWLQWLFGFVIGFAILLIVGVFTMTILSHGFIDSALNSWVMSSIEGSELELKELIDTHGATLFGIFALKFLFTSAIKLFISSRWYFLFRNFRNQSIFNSENVQLLRQSANWLLVDLATTLIMMPALLLVFLTTHSHGDSLSIASLSSSGGFIFEKLVIAAVIFLAAWILSIGRDMMIDRQMTV